LVQTFEAFRENSENGAARVSDEKRAALAQFATKFQAARLGVFDRVIYGLNRLLRPMLALDTLGLLVSAMASSVWFSSRMVGVALIQKPLWWLMGAIVSFYFWARYQVKRQAFLTLYRADRANGTSNFGRQTPRPAACFDGTARGKLCG
jgi:hypothetical protein